MPWQKVSANKKAGNFARSVLLHSVQRCYKFPIPHHPSSSNLIPFISQTPYIYLTGFQHPANAVSTEAKPVATPPSPPAPHLPTSFAA
nr:MAG TPA: hypothetical protein [Caudoviricetes sp.]